MSALFAAEILPLDDLGIVRHTFPVVLLAVFWSWETWRPFFGHAGDRWKHGGRNLFIAVLNTVVLAILFGSATVAVSEWALRNQYGLLNAFDLPGGVRLALTFVLLDGWLYVWHRANHRLPFLWRFHRMHHSDRQMDVTTATRFHLGEHLGASLLRLGLILLLGLSVWHLVVYDTAVIAATQFHHANISLGRWDRWLRLFVVTPDMHKIHHSDLQPETDSNYSTVLSVWDHLGRTFRMRVDMRAIVFGLQELRGPSWQTVAGMMKTPFASKIDPDAPLISNSSR